MMQCIIVVLSGLAWTGKLLLFVLDLNYWLVSNLFSLLFWTIHFILNLPGAITMMLLHTWDGMWSYMSRMGDSCCAVILSTLQSASSALKGGLAGLDALQLVWNLLCHVLLRSKEMMQRGLLNIALSGQTLNRQVWEALSIGGSLVAYFVNSLVNVCLIAMQNVFSALLAIWMSLVNVFLTGGQLVTALFSQLSSNAVAVTILLWNPCQLVLEGVASLSQGLGAIIVKHLYPVLLLLFLIWICQMLRSPATPFFHQFCDRINRLYQIFRMFIHTVVHSEVWRRAAANCLQLIRMYRAAWERDWALRRAGPQNIPARPSTAQNQPVRSIWVQNRAPLRMQNPSLRPPLGQDQVHVAVQNQEPAPSISSRNPVANTEEQQQVSEDPWKLLKQQEESKKCVICQDETKTVLLLPCRHLCLCNACTEILLQQPILQRNCPLCRKMILQTLDVYI
ncbi:E3 ubiquitin-protein ligase RNF26 [Pelodytes ibericus]